MTDRRRTRIHAPVAGLGPALLIALVASRAPLIGQMGPADGLSSPIDTATLAHEGEGEMEALLEKTIFKVDVLRVRIRFDQMTMQEMRRLARRGSDRAISDSISAIALSSRDVWARIRFERGLSLSQLTDGILKNVKKAWDAGIVSRTEYEEVEEGFPRWFGFLEERQVHQNDELWYRIRGDVMRTLYVTEGGEVLLDQADVGPGPRLTLLGGYFAPGSDLRDELIESLRSSLVPHP
jgi:hypothetical protein